MITTRHTYITADLDWMELVQSGSDIFVHFIVKTKHKVN